jgi:hypothetical protein
MNSNKYELRRVPIDIYGERKELFEMFMTYFDVDLDNCTMTHADWIEHVVMALTDDSYLERMMVLFQDYEDERSA